MNGRQEKTTPLGNELLQVYIQWDDRLGTQRPANILGDIEAIEIPVFIF